MNNSQENSMSKKILGAIADTTTGGIPGMIYHFFKSPGKSILIFPIVILIVIFMTIFIF